MSKPITVIMPFLNEGDEPNKTLESLYASTDKTMFDVIAVDDASDSELTDLSAFPDVTVVKHVARRGVDACRHEAICMAETPYVLVIDAHMRFTQDDWMARLLGELYRNENTVFCTKSIGLGYGIEKMEDAVDVYAGATLALYNEEEQKGRDGSVKIARQVLEGKWLEPEDRSDTTFECACIMGANYAFSKKWYHYIHGLQGLRKWGTSEPFLATKSWLAGGKVMCIPDIEIGHVYRDHSPFVTNVWEIVFNKLLMMSIVLPPEVSTKLIENIPKDSAFQVAYAYIANEHVNQWVSDERAYFDSIAKRDIYWFAEKFGIKI